MILIEELINKREVLKQELNEVDSKIDDIKKNCKHENSTVTRERDDVELRYYNFHVCNDCQKEWYSR